MLLKISISLVLLPQILSLYLDTCEKLPNGCQLKESGYICPQLDLNFTFEVKQQLPKNCNMEALLIHFNINQESILDPKSFPLISIEEFSRKIIKVKYLYKHFFMRSIKGFEINKDNPYQISSFIEMRFYETRFEFYSNGKPIQSCDALQKDGIKPKSIFHNIIYATYHFKTVQFKARICPLIFQDMPVIQFSFEKLINTFYKRNILEFKNLDNLTDINSNVSIVKFYNVEKVEVNSNLLSKVAFKNIDTLGFYGEVKSIELGLLTY
jgi:hypothetical protein